MQIVTITTDFGTKDYYLAALKGSILNQTTSVSLIDIHTSIKIHDIVFAAYNVKNAYYHFPKGSIHLIAVNNCYAKEVEYFAAHFDGHYFIAPNNGVLSLIFGEQQADIYKIEFLDSTASTPLQHIYSNAIHYLASGKPLAEIGFEAKNLVEKIYRAPIVSKDLIKGTVVHIDQFENIKVNISKDLFDKIGQNRNFELFFKRHNPIVDISHNYFDVPLGESLCLFDDTGFLEIAINMGKAASMLGVYMDDIIQIKFIRE